MNRKQRKLAHRASEAEKRASRTFSECLPPSAGYFDGRTPHEIDGVPTFRGKGAGGCGRMRYGRVERTRGGGLKLAPLGRDPGSVKHGGPLSPGERIMREPNGDEFVRRENVEAATYVALDGLSGASE
jgi:hypothetical protein